MPRQDVLIDVETEDLIFGSSKISFDTSYYRKQFGYSWTTLTVTLPRKYDQTANSPLDWTKYISYIKNNVSKISSSYNSDTLRVRFNYINSLNSLVTISQKEAVISNGDGTYSVITVEDYNNMIDTAVDENKQISIRFIDGPTMEKFEVSLKEVGDFSVGEAITQNEYVLLKANEGSILQSPVAGVGIKKYLNSPTGTQDMIDDIINKFDQDSLIVTNIEQTPEGLLRIESEDKNNFNGNI